MTHIQGWPLGLFALCVSVSVTVAGSAPAATVCVDAKQQGCFSTINAGIAAAAPGDTVLVAPGLWFLSKSPCR